MKEDLTDKTDKSIGGESCKTKKKPEKRKKLREMKGEHPFQLSLFEMPGEKDPKELRYSQAVIWDLFPVYHRGGSKRIEGRFLDRLEKTAVSKGVEYRIRIYPAAVEEKDGREKYYYLGEREEFVETALRKLVVEGKGIYLDGQAAVKFTLYELQAELARTKHTYSIPQIKDALRILNRADVEISSFDGKTEATFNPIRFLAFKGEDDETDTFVIFSELITNAINEGDFRAIDYDKLMSLKKVVARETLKRLTMNYKQASVEEDNPFSVKMSSLIRDYGLTNHNRYATNLRVFEGGFAELKDRNVLWSYKVEPILKQNSKKVAVDCIFRMYPSQEFVEDVKFANYKQKNTRSELLLKKTFPDLPKLDHRLSNKKK